MDFEDKVAVITGGAQGIGRCIAEEFRKAGAHVCMIDRQEGEHFVGDISDKDTLERFAREVKLFLPHFAEGAAIVNISSSRDRMSQPQTESYTAAKGGIAALTHALAVSLAGKVRVNSISPGWIDTTGTFYDGPDAIQQPAGRVGNPMDIASMVLYLCSDKAGFITGENICIDGGMTRQMIYHGDNGWKLEPGHEKRSCDFS